MASISRVLRQLETYRKRWDGAHVQPPRQGSKRDATAWLTETARFGANPGNLRMLSCVPPPAGAPPALVVVLHGCTQTAGDYARHAGWRQLAAAHGFALLCPEQRQANNAKRCFNWFLPADTAREGGECQSIAEMTGVMKDRFGIDPGRVFITGLSAGGAMVATMLARYPQLFAGGSIIAGLPHGAAGTVQGAFEAMFHPRPQPARALGERVRQASSHTGPWPRIAIWHGSEDRTVVPANAEELAKQWTDVHGIASAPEMGREGVATRTRWLDPTGQAAVDLFMINGMAHGAPVRLAEPDACGESAPFVLDAGISSSLVMARAWGLAPPHAEMADDGSARSSPAREDGEAGNYIADVINRALAAAGLTKR